MTTLSSRVAITKDVLCRSVSGEAVLLNVTTGEYYGLNDTGARMWELLIEDSQLAAAYQALLAEYEVAGADLERDLLGFVDTLEQRGLVEVVNV